MEITNLNIIIPESLNQDLKFLALRHGMSKRALIIKILTDYILNAQEKERGEK